MRMTQGGGNGATGVGYAVHLPPCWLRWFVSLMYVVEVVMDPLYIFIGT